MKIFIGLTDIANFTTNYAKGFKRFGHEVFTCVWNRSYFYPDEVYDVVIDQRPPGTNTKISFHLCFQFFCNFLKLLRGLTCDIFILYSPAILPTHIFLPILRFLGKKVVCIYHGSDIRYWYAVKEEMQQLGVADEMQPFFEFAKDRLGGSYFDKLRTVRTAEKYANLILSMPDYSQLIRRPYNRNIIPLDLTSFEVKQRKNEIPLVLHAPSIPAAKGTDHILAAVEELKAEGLQFYFQRIEKMPNKELVKLLGKADILVDQLYSMTISTVAAEAMASGCVAIARHNTYYSKIETPCPVVNTNIFTFKDDLKSLILDTQRRRELSEAGPIYVRNVNDCQKVAERIIKVLKNPVDQEFDFYPVFYQTFVMPKEILEEEKQSAKQRQANFIKTLFTTGTTKKQS